VDTFLPRLSAGATAGVRFNFGLHNRGVGTRDFVSLLELFDDDAEMRFTGVPIGPFRGIAQIAQAFRNDLPTDTACPRSTTMEPFLWSLQV
jgi:hypothetical protein